MRIDDGICCFLFRFVSFRYDKVVRNKVIAGDKVGGSIVAFVVAVNWSAAK